MKNFSINSNGKFEQIKELPFKLEREMQKLTEKNLNNIFDFSFVKSEFSLNGFRMDTLAFDNNTNSFVIIEYKRDKSFSVIDQGYAYLSLMLNNKADFILEYNENCEKTLRRNDIDWSQSKVIFVSSLFTPYQREAINFKDLPIELWEVKRYSNNTIIYTQVQTSGAQESIKTISKQDETIDKVSREIRVYTEQEHLEKADDETQELYKKVKNSIQVLGDFQIKPTKLYVAFVAGSNVIDIHTQKHALKAWLNVPKGQLDDPKKLARDVSTIGHWGNGDYEIVIKNDDELEYILSLVKQSLKRNMK